MMEINMEQIKSIGFNNTDMDSDIAREARYIYEGKLYLGPFKYFVVEEEKPPKLKKHTDVVKEIENKDKCKTCMGEGRVVSYDADPDWRGSTFEMCEDCGGTGNSNWDGETTHDKLYSEYLDAEGGVK